MPTDPLSTTLAALADPTRRGLLARLTLGESSVTELAEPYAMSLAAISKHLKLEAKANLERCNRRCRRQSCRLDAGSAAPRLPTGGTLADAWDAQPRPAQATTPPATLHGAATKMPAIDPAIPLEHRELTLIRTYDAPRALVFAALTDPRHLAHWWGPHGFTNPVCEFDPRPGGVLRIDMHAPDGQVYPTRGEVLEIVPPERLVFTVAALDPDGSSRLENLTTVTLVETIDTQATAAEGAPANPAVRTELTLHVRVLQATAAAAANLSGMSTGWNQSLKRLETLLTNL